MSEIKISFKDYFFGFLSILWRYPTIFRGIWKLSRLKLDKKKSIGKHIEKIAKRYPNFLSLLFEDKKYTYKEFNEWVNRFANYFLSIGVRKGEVINVFLENRPELLFILVAMSKIGSIASLINTNQRKLSLIHSFRLNQVNKFIIGEETLNAFEEIEHDLDLSKDINLYSLKDQGKRDVSDHYINLSQEILNKSCENPSTTGDMQLKNTYAYIFTSGTTGLPKAVPITNARTLGASIFYGKIVLNMQPDDVMYIPLPFYHSNAINVAWAAVLEGNSTLAMRRNFSASNFWKDIKKYKATIFNYIGEVCRYLLNQPPSLDDKNHDVDRITGNGLRPEIWKIFKKRFGIKEVYEFYGSTEFTGVFINLFNLDCTIGMNPAPYSIVKYDIDSNEFIREENGYLQKVEEEEPGLLLMKILEEQSFPGYTNKQAMEKKIIDNPFGNNEIWFNSGDIIKSIGNKHAQFVDRVGDTYRWKSENVSTTEVEGIIGLYKDIELVSVYGVKIPHTEGRAGMASILTSINHKDFNLKHFLKYLKENLPIYAIPYFIRFIREFRTTSTEKLIKTDIKKEGYNINRVEDPIYILLPKNLNYTFLTEDIYKRIIKGEIPF